MQQYIEELSNADVEWEADFVGRAPTLTGEAARRLAELGEQAIPELLRALSDPGRFAAAHVLLTRLSGVEYQAYPEWNGLKVDIAADGTVTIDPDQRLDLAKRWEHWYNTEPRPETLPPSE
jgi:hypothetical protein